MSERAAKYYRSQLGVEPRVLNQFLVPMGQSFDDGIDFHAWRNRANSQVLVGASLVYRMLNNFTVTSEVAGYTPDIDWQHHVRNVTERFSSKLAGRASIGKLRTIGLMAVAPDELPQKVWRGLDTGVQRSRGGEVDKNHDATYVVAGSAKINGKIGGMACGVLVRPVVTKKYNDTLIAVPAFAVAKYPENLTTIELTDDVNGSFGGNAELASVMNAFTVAQRD